MRNADLCLAALATGFLALLMLLAVHPRLDGQAFDERTTAARMLTARLGLTDPCLFTEARYARHPSQADLHSAFQDFPGALEHFPSGSLVAPPAFRGREPVGPEREELP